MAAEIFGQRIERQIRTVLNRALEYRPQQRIIAGDDRAVLLLLTDFVRRGFAILEPVAGTSYVYRSQDAELDKVIDQLATAYQERRVAVVSLIYSKPLNKVQTFADAFRLRRED